MKFDKKDWRCHKLSPNVISNNISQNLRLFITDAISNSEIKSARVKIFNYTRPTRDTASSETIYLDWTALTLTDDFYQVNFTITETLPVDTEVTARLVVEVTEEDDTKDFTNEINIKLRSN
jgi:hypothetical protein